VGDIVIKVENIFPIISKGKETTADILGVYVYDENVYLAVIIGSTNEFKVFFLLPNSLKDAGKKITQEFAKVVFMPEENTKLRDILLEGIDVTS
jgi:hypothetical protein